MEPGPGQDYIAKRYEADLALEARRVEGFHHHRATMKVALSDRTARREALQVGRRRPRPPPPSSAAPAAR